MSARGGRVAWVLGGAAIAAQIGYPLSSGVLRDRLTVAVVVLLALAAVVHAVTVRGPRWALGLVAVTALGGFLIELVGTRTGVPFGDYVYAESRLGPTVAGVPIVIGLAWTAGAYPAWCVARRVAGDRGPLRLLVAAVGLAGWDLFLDPQMVDAGLWVWSADGGLPGLGAVPISNYLGWLAVALVMAGLLALLPTDGRRGSDLLPLVLFCWTWLGSTVAHAVFLGLPASAVYGFVGMGLVGVPLLAMGSRSVWSRSADGHHDAPASNRPRVAARAGTMTRWQEG